MKSNFAKSLTGFFVTHSVPGFLAMEWSAPGSSMRPATLSNTSVVLVSSLRLVMEVINFVLESFIVCLF